MASNDTKKVIRALHECFGGYAIVFKEVASHKPEKSQHVDASSGGDMSYSTDPVAGQSLVDELKLLAMQIDKEATKLIVVFMKDPVVSSECVPVTDMFMKAVMLFASRWIQISASNIGGARYHMLRRCVLKLMQAGETLVKTLDEAKGKAVHVGHDSGNHASGSMAGGGAGEVSAAAKSFLKLPNTNAEAVCSWMSQASDMATDALEELEAAAAQRKEILAAGGGDGDDTSTQSIASTESAPAAAADFVGGEDDFFAQMMSNMMDMNMGDFTKWDAADMVLIPNVIGMIKVATKTISKTQGLVVKFSSATPDATLPSNLAVIEEILFDTSGEVTKHVDELVEAAYVPINKERLSAEAEIIHAYVDKILSAARQLAGATAPSLKWIDVLARAAVHNRDKLSVSSAE
eukprot:m.691686 g.691686  ORF g.691686 m.691686 type:complete len:405 (+) comp22856_c1_seq3:112-1326(+)